MSWLGRTEHDSNVQSVSKATPLLSLRHDKANSQMWGCSRGHVSAAWNLIRATRSSLLPGWQFGQSKHTVETGGWAGGPK